MKKNTQAGSTPATKPTARKTTAAGRAPANTRRAEKKPESQDPSLAQPPPEARSLTLPLQQVPTLWKRAAKDGGYSSVEEWAAAMLDVISWPGNRMSLISTDKQFKRWNAAALNQNKNTLDWIEETLDSSSAPKGARP